MMICEHGNIAPCVECDIVPLKTENESLRTMMFQLAEALERIKGLDSMAYHSLETAKIVARNALAAHRKQPGMYKHDC